jgi:hypothetical protein
MYNIYTIDECLIFLGSKRPFLLNRNVKEDDCYDDLSPSGYVSYDKLRSILVFMETIGVINTFNEDLLDEIVNERFY